MSKLFLAVLMLLFCLATVWAQDPRMEIKEQWVKNFYNASPRIGEKAPDFTLDTLGGGKVNLYEILKKKPVVLEFGNYTCPPFRKRTPSMKRLKMKWGRRAEFLVVYIRESNPDQGPFLGIKNPSTQEERDELAKRYAEEIKSSLPVSVDKIDNRVCKAYGEPFSASYIIKQDGSVYYKGPWVAPAKINSELARMFAGKPSSTLEKPAVSATPAALTTTSLTITGMVCQGCVIAVRNALSNVPGVESVEVELTTNKATIKHEDGRVSTAELIAAVKDTGYGVNGGGNAARNKEGASPHRSAVHRNHSPKTLP